MGKTFVTAYGDLYEVENYNIEPDGYIHADTYRKVGNPEWHSCGGFDGGTLFVDADSVDEAERVGIFDQDALAPVGCPCGEACGSKQATEDPVTISIPAALYREITG